MKLVKKSQACLICKNKSLVKYLDLGKTPLANSYLKKSQLKIKERLFSLSVYYCEKCHLAQLTNIVDRKLIFKNYNYFSSASPQLEKYFSDYASEVKNKFPKQAKFILEIASNDGILLKYFKKLGSKVLGVDPAKNIAKIANQNGIETLPIFFNSKIAKAILKNHGPAGIIAANNVLAHTDILNDMMQGISLLLDKDGVFVFEVQYLGDLLDKNEFDNTYHEHICYFSLTPLVTLLKMHNMGIFDVQQVSGQGGSIRVYAAHLPLAFLINSEVQKLLLKEKAKGLQEKKTYKIFGQVPNKIKNDLYNLLRDLRGQGKTIVGYGAAAKATTLLECCNIDPKTFDYIVDDSPYKQGKYMPGSHIPIISSKELKKNTPDYVLLLAWNYADSIMKKESWLKEKGVKFIKPIPNVKFI